MRSDVIAKTKHIAVTKSKKTIIKNLVQAPSQHRKNNVKTQEQDCATNLQNEKTSTRVWKSVLRTSIPAKPTIVTRETLVSEGWSEDVLNAMKPRHLERLLQSLTQHRWLFENKYE